MHEHAIIYQLFAASTLSNTAATQPSKAIATAKYSDINSNHESNTTLRYFKLTSKNFNITLSLMSALLSTSSQSSLNRDFKQHTHNARTIKQSVSYE